MLWPLLTCSLLLLLSTANADYRPCVPRQYPGADLNIVCVCNATYCDDIPEIGDIPSGKAVLYTSSLSGKRLERTVIGIKEEKKSESAEEVTISLATSAPAQEIIGFGCAFTDSAGINWNNLSPDAQQLLVEAYFGKEGLEYNMGRVPIASCDFSTHEYSYVDKADDYELKAFNLTTEDFTYKIPVIQKAKTLSPSLQLFASPWSAPGWMKTSGRMKGGAPLRNATEIYKSYAQYFIRFFEEYEKSGITFWGLTSQNEPSTGSLPSYAFQTMMFNDETQRDFIKNYLGPVLRANTLTKDLKLMALDDNRLFLPHWADTIFNDPDATKFVDGVAVHWYGNTYTPAATLDATHNRHPDKFILATEACAGWIGVQGPILGDFYRAEQYAGDIITDLNHFVAGWIDWNFALDETGGPNWVYNVVDSPIIVNRTADEFFKQPMYYALGHFSKFMPRGSTRVPAKIEGGGGVVHAAAVVYNGRRSLVVLNQGSKDYSLKIVDQASNDPITVQLERHSLITLIWNKANN